MLVLNQVYDLHLKHMVSEVRRVRGWERLT